jgi:hypothetical protein
MDDRPDRRAAPGDSTGSWLGFGLVNLGIMALAVLAIVWGYVLLNRGSVTAAPILLVLGYMVLLPLGLLFGYRRLRGRDSKVEGG